MTANEIVAELKKFATAQTKETWMNHGAQEPRLGVKVEDMKKIQKRAKRDSGAARFHSHLTTSRIRGPIGKKRKSPKC
jgi:hypothetical protein